MLGLVMLAGLVGLLFPHQVLTRDSGPTQAEVLVVLGGGGWERPDRAAELFRAGAAPAVICSGQGDCAFNRQRVVELGVPGAAVRTECESRNTHENAAFTVKLLRAQRARRVILVTSWYHSRRAQACFEQCAPEIQFFSRPSYFAYSRGDWSKLGILRHVFSEYVKLPGYWVRYGVCPF